MRLRRQLGEAGAAWHRVNLFSENELPLSSPQFDEGEGMPPETTSAAFGGDNLSPELVLGRPPWDGRQLLVVAEDVDASRRYPAVHCLALVEGERFRHGRLEAGALTAGREGPGVVLLRGTFGRGYVGPTPRRKGDGPHRYVFQLFILAGRLQTSYGRLDRLQPRALLDRVRTPVIARGRLTGVYDG